MRAILINPEDRTVTEVNYSGNYEQIYELIGCSTFTVIYVGLGDDDTEALFIDDEGLLHEPKPLFKWASYPQPLAGRGLILGENDEGDCVATKMTLDDVKAQVTWPAVWFTGFAARQYMVEDPLLGDVAVFERKAKFDPVQ